MIFSKVGKTYSILEFGRTHYENVAYFNFETNPKLNETLEENISPEYLIPLEVKSADNTKAKSLKVYMETHKPDYAIKLSTKNFGFEDGKKTVPLYAAFCV